MLYYIYIIFYSRPPTARFPRRQVAEELQARVRSLEGQLEQRLREAMDQLLEVLLVRRILFIIFIFHSPSQSQPDGPGRFRPRQFKGAGPRPACVLLVRSVPAACADYDGLLPV